MFRVSEWRKGKHSFISQIIYPVIISTTRTPKSISLYFHLCFIMGKNDTFPNLINQNKNSQDTPCNSEWTKQYILATQDKRSFGRDVPLRAYKGFVSSTVMKKEAHLSGGRMPTLNKEMGLQDAHTLLSVNDKHSPQTQPQTA